jgi:tRNA (guanosine-2'-O-)-methyltransferase
MATEKRQETIRRILDRRRDDVCVVIENVIDPHNIGAVARSFDCIGGLDLHIINTKRVTLKGWRNTSIRADRWLRVHIWQTVESCYARLRRDGFRILAGDLSGTPQSIYDIDFTAFKPALVFGEEHAGISDEARKLADGSFIIPQIGASQSLNISVAAAVTLYELFRQRTLAGMTKTTLGEPDYNALLDKWSAVLPEDRIVVEYGDADGVNPLGE